MADAHVSAVLQAYDQAMQAVGVPHEALSVYDSNSLRRVGLARQYEEVMAPTVAPDGHPDIWGVHVLRAMVAAFNAMLSGRAILELPDVLTGSSTLEAIASALKSGADVQPWELGLIRRRHLAEIEHLQRDLADKQARIDALMLEFCPGEMSAEQRAEWSESQRAAHEAPAQSSNELATYAIDLVDGPNSGVIGRMKRDAEGNYYLRTDVDAVIERLQELVKDLQQFHDWAEPQITDLNRDSYSKLLREIDEYLSRSPAEAIHASSIFHQQIKEALQSAPSPRTEVCVETAFAGTVCPFTKRPYFMHLEHQELGRVPTYGGPFDSYTIPAPDDDEHLRCERFDHDAGNWVEGGEPTGLLVISERELSRLAQPPLPDYRTAMKQAEGDDGIDSLTLVRVLQKKVADQQCELARLNARTLQPQPSEVAAAATRVANEIELFDQDDPFKDDLRVLIAAARASRLPKAWKPHDGVEPLVEQNDTVIPIEIGVGKVRIAKCWSADDPQKVVRELVIYDDGGEQQPPGTEQPEHRGKKAWDIGRILARVRIVDAVGAQILLSDLQEVIENARLADSVSFAECPSCKAERERTAQPPSDVHSNIRQLAEMYLSELPTTRAMDLYATKRDLAHGVMQGFLLWIEATSGNTSSQPSSAAADAHMANEWADMASNGLQWLRNIRDGVSTTTEALDEMQANYVRIMNLRTTPTKAGEQA